MDKINEFFEYMRSLKQEQVIEIIVAVATLALFITFGSFIAYGILRIFYKKDSRDQIRDSKLYKNIRNFAYISGIYVASLSLEITMDQKAILLKLYKICTIWFIANIVSNSFEVSDALNEKLDLQNLKKKYRGEKEKTKKDKFMEDLSRNIIKIVAYIVATYLSLKEFGYDLGNLVTGLGIVGAVIALAAQDVVKQLIAGAAILSDKPFEIGDWIEANGDEGTVEEITWRSTKIRNSKDEVITIDNNVILSANVTNSGKIKKRVYQTNIRLPLETTEMVVERIINRIRFVLKYNKDVIRDSISVQLLKIDGDGLEIEIYLDTKITNLNAFKAFKNKVNLTILNILETQGVTLAYPGQNIYIKDFNNKLEMPEAPVLLTKADIQKSKKKSNSKTKPIKVDKE